MSAKPARLLIIAGSDSSGGAGIQADVKTADAFGVYAMTAVTAITVQDTTGVRSVHPVPAKVVRAQIAACLNDIGTDAIKIGMLSSAEIAAAVAGAISKIAQSVPVVLDPVMLATSGKTLLSREAMEVLKSKLVPLARLVTPNLPEASRMTGVRGSARAQAETAGRKLIEMGAKAALIKGGHATAATVDDVLVWERGVEVYASPRLRTKHTHGTGCTLATGIACGLAQGLPLPVAVGKAREFVQKAIETAPGFGHGHGPLNYFAPV